MPPDPETLRRIAEVSRGEAFAVEDAERLEAVYERLGSQVATKKEKREVTTAFAGGALHPRPGRRRAVAAVVRAPAVTEPLQIP